MQNAARIDQKKRKEERKKRLIIARRGDWRLSDLMGRDVAATAGSRVVYGRVQHSTVGPATTQSKVRVTKERKNLRTQS